MLSLEICVKGLRSMSAAASLEFCRTKYGHGFAAMVGLELVIRVSRKVLSPRENISRLGDTV
jgi:hypothetical protein